MNLINYFNKSIRSKLIALFLILSMMPFVISIVIMSHNSKKTWKEQTFCDLEYVGKAKLNQIINYFYEIKFDIDVLSKVPVIIDGLENLKAVHDASGMGVALFMKSDRYKEIVKSMDAYLKNYKERYGYRDIFIIDQLGNILYTVEHKADFGTNILNGPYKDSSLGKSVRSTQEKRDISFSDYQPYAPSNYEPAAFIANVIKNNEGELHGYVAAQISIAKINAIMQERTGLEETAKTYLVGEDYLMRNDSRLILESTILKKKVDTKSVKLGLQKKSGFHVITDYRDVPVLSYYSHLGLKEEFNSEFDWVILAEMDETEVLAKANKQLYQFSIIGITLMLLVVIVAFFFSRSITKSIIKLTNIAKKIALGDLNQIIDIDQKDEIGELADSLNQMVGNFQEVVRQTDVIASGDYRTDITPRSDKDSLGLALQRMTKELLGNSEKNRIQDLLKSGQNELNQKMRGDQDIISLTRNVITFISKYLDAQIGAIYLTNEDGKELKLTGSYAFSKRKNLNTTIKFGEGLVGQAAFEKEMILLGNVPEDYIHISSSLGDTIPRNILVSPFMLEGKVLGVVELGSIREFSDNEMEFIKSAMENIAIAVNSANARTKMKKLLNQTQQQAEELQAQQEMLRVTNEELEQQTEELKASQEKLKEQQEELQASNEELEEKTDFLEKQKTEISKKNEELEKVRTDIEKKAEELEISSKYKSEFLANMSHELRTPLNSLLILARDLADNKKGNLENRQVEAAEIIYNSGNDLLNLINEILDLSKIEAGKMATNIQWVEVQDIINNININFKHQTDKKGLKLKTKMGGDVPEKLLTDQQRLEQIIKNLISNSLKFTEKGNITIDVFRPGAKDDLSRSGLKHENAIAISVTDTGIGIPADKQASIFEAFKQADGSTSRKFGGTGLGLSISRELAKLLGGEIQLKSLAGEGSTFTIYIAEKLEADKKEGDILERRKTSDRSVPTEERRIEPDRRIKKPVLSTSKKQENIPAPNIEDDREHLNEDDKTVLVIEDDCNFARTLYRFCQEKGFKFLHAADGETGIELAQKYKPNGIILDLKLPGMDGWAVLDILKEDLEIRHIPVHIMSAADENMEAFEKGAIGYLTKPADKGQIEEAFKKLESFYVKKIKDLLIVEDDEDLSKAIVRLIEEDDVKITTTGLGEEALSLLKSKTFDCMILDLGLPDISGFDVLKEMDNPEIITKPPVIIYTGRDISSEEEQELRKYADSIILKDVKSEERLLDETALFLHRVVDELPKNKQKTISGLHSKDAIFKGKEILLVDDDMRNVFALSHILEENGMNVQSAANGEKALEILKNGSSIDLVLMDIMMPVMDGYEAMRRIRVQKQFENLPIIALTAKAMKSDREKCIEAGANDYLPKPIQIDTLLSLMRVWLYK